MNPIDPDKLPNTDDIIKQVAAIKVRLKDPDMLELKKTDKLAHRMKIEREFFDFFEIYPSVFRHIYQDGDMKMLAQMLCAIDEIKTKRKTVEKAEAELGEQLAEQYLKGVGYKSKR